MSIADQPVLADGTLVLRAWREADVEAAVSGHDHEISHWLGRPHTTPESFRTVIGEWSAGWRDGTAANFVIESDADVVGWVEVRHRRPEDSVGDLSWTVFPSARGRGLGTRAVRMLIDWAMSHPGQGGLGLTRVQTRIEPDNHSALRVASRAGLRREGTQRVAPGTGDRPDTTAYVVLARLADDPPLSEPESFRALLNSFLPRKRAIAQLLLRDPHDRVLLCHLTYKRDWDLPGGVVEPEESPRTGAERELSEELGLDLSAGRLLLTDWLPAWGGWDDAVCLVFDGGVHDPALVERLVYESREIRSAEFCDSAQVAERAADFTARRIQAALASLAGQGPSYSESGR